MSERAVIGRVDGRDVTVWNDAAAGRPSPERVKASVDEAHAALAAYAKNQKEK